MASLSSREIAYAREKRIAVIMNDMVEHLLATQPTDSLGSLIGYLERLNQQQHDATGMGPDHGRRGSNSRARVAPRSS